MSLKKYPSDTFTENDVLIALERQGLKFKNGKNYITTQCPLHADLNPSCQIFKDDWFCNCLSGCGRFHITKAFPLLRENAYDGTTRSKGIYTSQSKREEKAVSEYKDYNLMDYWQQLPLIPREHQFKNIPLECLDELGWRWFDGDNDIGIVQPGYFIPYFSSSKTRLPFIQVRHLTGERRFTFLPNAQPTCYGTWNIDNKKIFLVEGCSDAALMHYLNVPSVALPSASSGVLMEKLALYAAEHEIRLVYAGDNDAAGEKLREALDGVSHYRVWQPPKQYKDWCEFYEARGLEEVSDYCYRELFDESKLPKTAIEEVLEVFPEAKVLTMIGPQETKEQPSVGEPIRLL